MKFVHWFSLCTALVGMLMLVAGLPKIGGFIIFATTIAEVIYAAVVGKKSNTCTR